jgi:hypothetical protein
VDNFAQFWREGREWGGEGRGGQADEAMLERGRKERIRGCWALADLHAQLVAHNPGHGPGEEISNPAQKWAHLMGKRKEQGDAEMQ